MVRCALSSLRASTAVSTHLRLVGHSMLLKDSGSADAPSFTSSGTVVPDVEAAISEFVYLPLVEVAGPGRQIPGSGSLTPT